MSYEKGRASASAVTISDGELAEKIAFAERTGAEELFVPISILTELAALRSAPAPEWQGMEDYVVWSNEHRAWWRAEAAGYSTSIAGAGLYTRAEAIEIAGTSRDGWTMDRVPDEIAVSLADIPAHIRAAVLALHGRAA